MMRSGPTSGLRAVKASALSSGSNEIQHWRRKYSEGFMRSQGTSQPNTS